MSEPLQFKSTAERQLWAAFFRDRVAVYGAQYDSAVRQAASDADHLITALRERSGDAPPDGELVPNLSDIGNSSRPGWVRR